MIILIVLVFDPLAVLLLIAANISYTTREPKKKKVRTKVAKKSILGYTKDIKGSIYNFMMRDDFGISHTDKVNENESTRKVKEK